MKKVGFTTSVPVEVLFSAGCTPVDLNNIFITNTNPEKLVDKAELDGFPRSTCAWIKGIYSSVLNADIDTVIGVIEGDCSNTKALIEVLSVNKIDAVPFSYPHNRDYDKLKREIEHLCDYFGTTMGKTIEVKKKIDLVRKKVRYLDELCWKYNKVTGFENHLWQVSCSDFNGNYEKFSEELDLLIERFENRKEIKEELRIGYIGVPPINADLYDFLESISARVVFNEVQRQFTLMDGAETEDIVETYLQFTYPYDLKSRLDDIKKEISNRKLDAIIHYTQAFCFRGIEDIIIRKELNIPVITLEGDKPGNIDARTKLRLESFIDMTKSLK